MITSFGIFVFLGFVWSISSDVHACVRASRKIAQYGGQFPCMQCDPTLPFCEGGCQKLVDQLYRDCDGVCLPDGFYFDINSKAPGCWEENLRQMKINVERCGCNSASRNLVSYSIVFASITLLAYILFL